MERTPTAPAVFGYLPPPSARSSRCPSKSCLNRTRCFCLRRPRYTRERAREAVPPKRMQFGRIGRARSKPARFACCKEYYGWPAGTHMAKYVQGQPATCATGRWQPGACPSDRFDLSVRLTHCVRALGTERTAGTCAGLLHVPRAFHLGRSYMEIQAAARRRVPKIDAHMDALNPL